MLEGHSSFAKEAAARVRDMTRAIRNVETIFIRHPPKPGLSFLLSAYSAENKKGPAPAGKAIFWEGQNTSKETQSEVGNAAGGEES